MPKDMIGINLGNMLDNLDTIPDDVTAIEALLEADIEETSEPDVTATTEESDADVKTEEDVPTAKEEVIEPEKDADLNADLDADANAELDTLDADSTDEDAPVLAADGKSQIPYSVLKTARAKNVDLQQQLDDANALLNDKQAEQVPKDPVVQDVPVVDEPQTFDSRFESEHGMSRDKFKEDFGADMAGIVETQLKGTIALEDKLALIVTKQSELESREDARVVNDEKDLQDDIQVAIDLIPTLADWQANNPSMWAAAVAIDTVLRQDPEFSDASFSDRFKEVIIRLGHTDETKPTTPSKEDLQKKAEELETKADSDATPTSLSETPGAGEPHAQSEVEKLEGMSITQLEVMFEKMTPDQQEAYLAKI